LILFVEKSLRQLRRDPGGTALTLLTTPACCAVYGLLMGSSGARSFEAYVPGLLVLSVIMIVFSSAMNLARELESGAMARMRTWPRSTASLLFGGALVQLGLAALSTSLTLGTARLLGFAPRGSLVSILLLGVIAAQASVGLGLVVASLTRSQHRAFLVASVTMFALLLFSGVVFPRPALTLLTLGGVELGPFDLLPTTHLHEALSRVLAGGSLWDVGGRALALFGLSGLAFAVGLFVFQERHGSPGAR
jgi:ABC-2 type transport system permease protein